MYEVRQVGRGSMLSPMSTSVHRCCREEASARRRIDPRARPREARQRLSRGGKHLASDFRVSTFERSAQTATGSGARAGAERWNDRLTRPGSIPREPSASRSIAATT